MDFKKGGELFYHLSVCKRFPENGVILYAAELILAISHLHSKGIIYRDLKPENVLLDEEGHISITDFGLCKLENDPSETFDGTPEYISPEIIDNKIFGRSTDWWSFGTLIYELL